jgi:NitT/TauT family transport system substrate-binding protein
MSMPVLRRLALLAPAALLAVLLLVGPAQTRPQRPAADRVNYATSFGNFGRDSYIYVAIEKGYMRQADIDVNVTSGTGSVDGIKLVGAGRIDFTPVDAGTLVVTRANERIPVRAVSVVLQNTMSAIFSLQETGIRRPSDLVGKTIADAPGSTVRVLFPLWAKKVGLDVNRVTFRDAAPPALPALLAAKQVDAVGQFVVGRPLFASAAGKPIAVMRYSDRIPGLLGNVIIARDEMIRSNPGLVRRFVRALNRGLQYAVNNPAEAAAIHKKYQPLINEDISRQELAIQKSFVETRGTRQYGVGYIDLQKVKSTRSVIVNGFRLQNPISFSDLYAPGFVRAATYRAPKRK